MLKSPFTDPVARHLATRFGMTLFLISLGVLFLSTVVGLVVVRVQLERQGLWPADLPSLPRGLALGTVVLLVSGVTMHWALVVARGDGDRFATAMRLTIALGVLFLLLQAASWLAWLATVRERWSESEEWRIALMGFYVLTGLHGLHVLGGLAALLVTDVRARRGRYSPDDRRDRVLFCTMYWHFLGVVWLVLYGLLLVWN